MFACFSLTEMFQLSVQLTSDLRITMKISDLAVQIQTCNTNSEQGVGRERMAHGGGVEDEGASMTG